MKLIPRLTKTKMFLSFGERVEVDSRNVLQVEQGRKELDVEEWDRTGLAIHEYFDEYGRRYNWRISHMVTGRAILKHMRSRDQAIEYLQKLRGIKRDWMFTLEQFDAFPDRGEIKKKIDALQKSISGVRR